jgi:hypothetical protein
LVFFSILAIRPRVAGVHIPSFESRPQTAFNHFSNGL